MTGVTVLVRDRWLWLVVALAAFVRLVPVFASDFPLNDGGLFATVIDALLARGVAPPPNVVEYNGTAIPFAYPPAGFYVATSLGAIGVDTVDVLRFLPAVLSIATVPAWFVLARLLVGERQAIIAAAFFALMPRSYEWLIGGGGLTRALGLLLAIVALVFVVQFLRERAPRDGLLGGLLSGLTILAHPEAALLVVATVVLIAVVDGAPLMRLVRVGLVAAAVALPWVAYVVTFHGWGPLLAAGGSRISAYPLTIMQFVELGVTDEPYFLLGAVLGVTGLFIAATSRRRWIPVWIAVMIVLTPAAAATFAMLPLSLGAAIAVDEFISPRLSPRWRIGTFAIGLATMLVASVWSVHLEGSPLRSVHPDVRAAVAWADDNLPSDSRVIVVTGVHWPLDAVSEWLPYLSDLESINTVQGQEFTGQWSDRLRVAEGIVYCSRELFSCIDSVVRDHFPDTTAIIVPKGNLAGTSGDDCCTALRESMRDEPGIVYDGPGATVLHLSDGP